MRRTLTYLIVVTALVFSGCSDEIIVDSLAANDPTRPEAPIGRPPVPPESLTIAPTGMAPTATPAINPDPILPNMDEVYRTRRLPAGVEREEPGEEPAEHEGPPEEHYQLEEAEDRP